MNGLFSIFLMLFLGITILTGSLGGLVLMMVCWVVVGSLTSGGSARKGSTPSGISKHKGEVKKPEVLPTPVIVQDTDVSNKHTNVVRSVGSSARKAFKKKNKGSNTPKEFAKVINFRSDDVPANIFQIKALWEYKHKYGIETPRKNNKLDTKEIFRKLTLEEEKSFLAFVRSYRTTR